MFGNVYRLYFLPHGLLYLETKLLETIKETEKQSKDLFFYGAVIVISVMTSILAILLWRK